jgi:tripartite-type tricarboxylate transporter receptor subunit TctC
VHASSARVAVGDDARRDFVPVAHVTNYDFAVAAGSAAPVREFNDLAAWLRANPEQANFGVPATESLLHFFGLMIGESIGVKAQIVGYRGSAPAITDLIAGTTPVAVDALDALLPHQSGGQLRILTMRSPMRRRCRRCTNPASTRWPPAGMRCSPRRRCLPTVSG